MPDSPAAELRHASSLMRERAESARCDGLSAIPWRVGPKAGCSCCEAVTDATGSLIADTDDRQSAHIASWHPGVALAVADWLDAEAERAELTGFSLHSLSPGALAAARAYLKGGTGG